MPMPGSFDHVQTATFNQMAANLGGAQFTVRAAKDGKFVISALRCVLGDYTSPRDEPKPIYFESFEKASEYLVGAGFPVFAVDMTFHQVAKQIDEEARQKHREELALKALASHDGPL